MEGNYILNNKSKQIDSVKSSKAKNKANPNNEDIIMKDEVKQTKIKKWMFIDQIV